MLDVLDDLLLPQVRCPESFVPISVLEVGQEVIYKGTFLEVVYHNQESDDFQCFEENTKMATTFLLINIFESFFHINLS